MQIGLRTTTHQVNDQSWLANRVGIDANKSITLDVSLFTEADHYPNGYLISGITLGRVTASGLYGPYANGAVDGREVNAGHLFSSVTVDPTDTTKDVGGALYRFGFVVEANLPDAGAMVNGGIDAAGKTDVAGWIAYD